jgi:phosphopantothenoylcysteine decarboxylase/phosphopantothenate--cysteine ligase
MKKGTKSLAVLVTAGPTRAYLDNVRYLSNYSSGQLGYEICRFLEKKIGKVVAVVGPCEAPFHQLKKTKVVKVQTVEEMHKAVMESCRKEGPQFAVLSAAVLDFEPKKIRFGKVSSKNSWKIELVPTLKIIDEIGHRFPKIKKIAFKLEWESMSEEKAKKFALKNMKAKSADALCLNFLSQIKSDSHPAMFFTSDGRMKRLKSKREIAAAIGGFILDTYPL